jgi:catechol 2,3-dioxygenase-like lactoylglutathione lyase family enzyme
MLRRIHFQSVGALDVARARDFYRDRLGLTVARDEPYGDDRWVFMALPEGGTLLHFDKVSTIAPHTAPKLVLVADDVDATCAGLAARGVAVEQGPADAPWDPATRWATIRDSEGNLVLIQTARGA